MVSGKYNWQEDLYHSFDISCPQSLAGIQRRNALGQSDGRYQHAPWRSGTRYIEVCGQMNTAEVTEEGREIASKYISFDDFELDAAKVCAINDPDCEACQ